MLLFCIFSRTSQVEADRHEVLPATSLSLSATKSPSDASTLLPATMTSRIIERWCNRKTTVLCRRTRAFRKCRVARGYWRGVDRKEEAFFISLQLIPTARVLATAKMRMRNNNNRKLEATYVRIARCRTRGRHSQARAPPLRTAVPEVQVVPSVATRCAARPLQRAAPEVTEQSPTKHQQFLLPTVTSHRPCTTIT